MNFVQQLEECLRDLAAEARKQHPGVKEACERATLQLRALQTGYAQQVRNAASQGHPTTALFACADLWHPFLLATNYPYAGMTILEICFRAMRLLLVSDALLPQDAIHVVRVWRIQAQVCLTCAAPVGPVERNAQLEPPKQTDNAAVSKSWFANYNPARSVIMSSSAGRTGSAHTTFSHGEAEKIALEILSCALQLVSRYYNHLSPEVWTQTASLIALWLQHHTTCQQAARSTLSQTLSYLYQTTENNDNLKLATWEDLLTLASSTNKKLHGALADAQPRPDLEFTLTLLHQIWPLYQSKKKERIFAVLLPLLQTHASRSAEIYSKAVTLVTDVVNELRESHTAECNELGQALLAPIIAATEKCRHHPDFEDGYVYAAAVPNSEMEAMNTTILLQEDVLQKVSVALDALEGSLYRGVVQPAVCEALSDFCTLCASCQGHLHAIIQQVHNEKESTLGHCVYQAFRFLLRMAQDLPDDEQVLDDIFAPFLSVLQHYMKRLVGCREFVEMALEGYILLAHVTLSRHLQRKALLTSLCKLSLPSSWNQPQLSDHHVRTLLTLLRLVHLYLDHIGSDWEIIIWTLEELSTLSMASPSLSDEGYHGALAVAAVYPRLPAVSTVLSSKNLQYLVAALVEVVQRKLQHRDVITASSETVVREARVSTTGHSKEDKESISERLVNMGVRAIYGSSSGEQEKTDLETTQGVAVTERTRSSFYEEYRRDFVKRISNAERSVRVFSIDQLPFVMILLADACMANSFRYNDCGESMSQQLSSLASLAPAIRPFVMDIMALLTISHLSTGAKSPAPFIGPGKLVFGDPMQSQLLAVERLNTKVSTNEISSNISQADLLAPLCTSMRRTEKADVAESALETVHSILEGSGHNLRGEVWNMVIVSVASLSGDPLYEMDRSSQEWLKCCHNSFRCLKFIVDDFLEQLQSDSDSASSTRSTLLDCCSSFGRSQHDLNISLTAIGLLWNIADQDSGMDSVDHALVKLVHLASDNRTEVRNAAVNTLFSCIAGRGARFSDSQWKRCIITSVFRVYDVVSRKNSSEEDGDHIPKTRKSRYKVSMHHSRDSTTKQWMATQVLVLQGIMRILRSFFPQLLSTASFPKKDIVPWFQDCWVQILDFAYDAACQEGGRDTVEIRSAGVELMVLCSQLASRAGLLSALTPARISTSMEVVNGALRAVRLDENHTKENSKRTFSKEVDQMRENLFLESFESLESFEEHLTKINDTTDETTIQVLHKFASSLGLLYECCKDEEFSQNGESDVGIDADNLEGRFVQMIRTIIHISSIDPKARFLNQAQRSCLDIMETMASQGSYKSLRYLVAIAGTSFFTRRVSDEGDDVDASPTDEGDVLNVLSFESANFVGNIMRKESFRDMSKVTVLTEILEIFQKMPPLEPHYKRLIPIISEGLSGATRQYNTNKDLDKRKRQLDDCWGLLLTALSKMLSPVRLGEHVMKISRVIEIREITEVATLNVPVEFKDAFCDVLVAGASNCYEVAELNEAFVSMNEKNESFKIGVRKSKKHIEDVLVLFRSCLSAIFSLQPDKQSTRKLAREIFSKTLSESTEIRESAMVPVSVQSTQIMCELFLRNERMEGLVVSVFPILCNLIISSNSQLKDLVLQVFSVVDVANIFQTSQHRLENAEVRAVTAEKEVESLRKTVDELMKRINVLERNISILEASSGSIM